MNTAEEEIARLTKKAEFATKLNEIMSALKIAADYVVMAIKNDDDKEANRSAQRAATDLRHAADLIEQAVADRQHGVG